LGNLSIQKAIYLRENTSLDEDFFIRFSDVYLLGISMTYTQINLLFFTPLIDVVIAVVKYADLIDGVVL